jgi:hypothetical protein
VQSCAFTRRFVFPDHVLTGQRDDELVSAVDRLRARRPRQAGLLDRERRRLLDLPPDELVEVFARGGQLIEADERHARGQVGHHQRHLLRAADAVDHRLDGGHHRGPIHQVLPRQRRHQGAGGSGSNAKLWTVASDPRAETTAPDTESGASSSAASGGGLASQEVKMLIVFVLSARYSTNVTLLISLRVVMPLRTFSMADSRRKRIPSS